MTKIKEIEDFIKDCVKVNGIRLRAEIWYNNFYCSNKERNIKMEAEKSLIFWSEVKEIFKKVSDKFA